MLYGGIEQLVARQAHNLKVIGSSPIAATKMVIERLETTIASVHSL